VILILVIISLFVFANNLMALEMSVSDNQITKIEENLFEIEFGGESYLVEDYYSFQNKIQFGSKPLVALSIAGGGARAIANVGVIKALVENDIPFDFITGTSMGTIVSSLYGSGLSLAQIEDIVTDTPFANLFNFGGGALLNSRKANEFMELVAPQKQLENFLIPTAQLSFDLKAGKKYLATTGKVSDVLQAAYAIPGYFPIHSRNDRYFIDAGVLEVSPAKSASLLGADFVLATFVPKEEGRYQNYDSAFQSANRFIEIMQEQYSGQVLDRYADFLITIDVGKFTFMDFNYGSRLVEIGYEETMKRMPELKKALAAAEISLRKTKKRDYYDIDSILRDLEFDRLIVEEKGINPLIYYGSDFSPFSQNLFRSPLNKFQFGAEIYRNNLKLSILGFDSWEDGYTAFLRYKKLTDKLDLNFKYGNDYDSKTDSDYEFELIYFANRFNLAAGYGRRKDNEYFIFGTEFRYLGNKFQWQTENDIFYSASSANHFDILTSQQINYDFTPDWSIGSKLVYNSSDFIESPLIYKGQKLNGNIDLQASLNFNYNYNLQLPLELLNFLQLTDVGGYLFVDYYSDHDWTEEGLAVGPAFNTRLYLLGLKPIEVDLFVAHDFEIKDQRYGLNFSYMF